MAGNKEKNGFSFKKIPIIIIGVIILSGIIGLFIVNLFGIIKNLSSKSVESISFDLTCLGRLATWLYGLAVIAVISIFIALSDKFNDVLKFFGLKEGDYLKGEAENIDSVLENSRFMTSKERDSNFTKCTYKDITSIKKDGIPIRAVMEGKNLSCNFLPGAHALVIGATGSGKTTTFINPMIQLLGAAGKGSSMIITDPKGELFDLHSKFLRDKGYNVMVFDLRDTYASSRWNPLESIWDMYQDYLKCGNDIKIHRDSIESYPDLKILGGTPEPGSVWAEWEGRAFSDLRYCQDEITVAKRRIYDEMYEDLSDLVSGICPITNEKDPLWEKGARSIVLATCIAMLEDSQNPDLHMTKDKFNFYNLNKILTNSENDYQELKNYFTGRNKLSQAVSLSKQVMSAPTQTMSSYMSITFDKMSLFNDNGICGLTSSTDIHAEDLAFKPTAVFLKIPDEKDTRHGLASLFILSIYKALIKVASGREDLSLPRNVYFILDEFGNMPKIEKFGQMITVGRSRKIWFNMVVQSYSQLNNVYGETVADIVKSNCGMKMFIGSNDIGTCKEFSELCGNMTVKTTSTSKSTAKEGELNVSNQIQTRPLIYPSELQKLNNKESTGNAVIVTFGNYPLMTKYTPSYKCPFYVTGRMNTDEIRANVFRPDDIFYDISVRNQKVLG